MDPRFIRTLRLRFAMIRMIKLVYTFLLFPLLGTFAADVMDIEKAELLFERGRYELAKTHFQNAVDQQPLPSLYFNLALIDLNLNQLASARWQIEQARILAPINTKYRLLEAHIVDRLKLPAQNNRLIKTTSFLSVSQWSWVASLAGWCGVCFLIFCVFNHRLRVRLAIVCCVLLTLLAFSLYARDLQITRLSSAIVCAQTPVTVHSAPAKNAPEIGTVALGERIQVLGEHLNYLQVVDANDTSGWLPKSDVLLIPSQIHNTVSGKVRSPQS